PTFRRGKNRPAYCLVGPAETRLSMTEPTTPADNSPRNQPAPETAAGHAGYRELARKYRPTDFTSMIRQDALLPTLTTPTAQGRLAHRLMRTGLRAVGSATTPPARARCCNCSGRARPGGPPACPRGVCDNCRGCDGVRHVDVIEMDAASRTGIDDIR